VASRNGSARLTVFNPPSATQTAANLYSLIQSARLSWVEPKMHMLIAVAGTVALPLSTPLPAN
jgi:hypothetical protein